MFFPVSACQYNVLPSGESAIPSALNMGWRLSGRRTGPPSTDTVTSFSNWVLGYPLNPRNAVPLPSSTTTIPPGTVRRHRGHVQIAPSVPFVVGIRFNRSVLHHLRNRNRHILGPTGE